MTSTRHALRAPPADFVGRKVELTEILSKMGGGGVTISALQGQGGIGKTALALKIAEALRPRYPDAQIDLDLRGASPSPMSTAAVMAHVIHAFDPTARLPEDLAELGGIYRTALHDKRALLLFDNARDRAQVEPLLPPAGSVMIVTSRQAFHLPGIFARNLDELAPADAIALLKGSAPRLTLGEAAEIAGLCGRLPIALCLAGSALAEQRNLEPREYIEQLTNTKERLGLVEGSLSLSFDLLDARLQTFWCCLGVFPWDFDREAAATVGEMELTTTRQALGDLLKCSMVSYDEETRRYRLHDLSRLYAVSRLCEANRYGAELRHARYFEGVLVSADALYKKGGASIVAGLAIFDREWVNIEAGQAWAASRAASDDAAAGLCSDYPDVGVYYLELRQHPRDRIRWREAALGAARRLGRRGAEGAHLGNLGITYRTLGEPRRAIELYEQCLVILREIGDKWDEGNALGNMGLAYADLGEPSRAIELYEQHLTIAREIGNKMGEGNALGNMGLAYADLGEPSRAIELYERGLAIARDIGDKRGEANASWNLGLRYETLGELDKAVPLMQVYVDFLYTIGHADAAKRAARVNKLRARLKK